MSARIERLNQLVRVVGSAGRSAGDAWVRDNAAMAAAQRELVGTLVEAEQDQLIALLEEVPHADPSAAPPSSAGRSRG